MENNCNICNSSMDKVLKFDRFPVTGLFRDAKQDKIDLNYDQGLLFCHNCKHSRIANIIPSEKLYNETYSFRTSESATARVAANYFLDFLDKTFDGLPFDNILEFGCNDGYALKKLKKGKRKLLGVDLIWNDRENEFDDQEILISGVNIQDVDMGKYFNKGPDFIFSCHTMEHIPRPKELLDNLYSKTPDNAIFAFEFPCFDILLKNIRFDQIFHEHVNYFSLDSVRYLLDSLGAELINSTINHNHWGSLIVVFKKFGNIGKNKFLNSRDQINENNILSQYGCFITLMRIMSELIDKSEEPVFGYGAALMLPALSYHLKNDLSKIVGIIDDDPQKIGLRYYNMDTPIISGDSVDYSSSTILLTALDNRRSIIDKLNKKLPIRIINPLPIL